LGFSGFLHSGRRGPTSFCYSPVRRERGNTAYSNVESAHPRSASLEGSFLKRSFCHNLFRENILVFPILWTVNLARLMISRDNDKNHKGWASKWVLSQWEEGEVKEREKKIDL
jgi:hypothetical protein